jgi:hypothetical protein
MTGVRGKAMLDHRRLAGAAAMPLFAAVND